ncbi:hypothetical protein HMI55_005795, partial [Coelomomyces lativittatus]
FRLKYADLFEKKKFQCNVTGKGEFQNELVQINFRSINNENKDVLHKNKFTPDMIGNMKTWQDLYSLKNLNLSVNCLLFDPLFNFEVIIPFKFQKTYEL